MGNLIQDLRYGLRSLLKSPGLTAAAVLTLGIGIGANTAIFALLDALLLRPLPYHEPERLEMLYVTSSPASEAPSTLPWSYPKLQTLRQAIRGFESVAAFVSANMNLTDTAEPQRLSVEMVSASYFPLLGAGVALGSPFTEEEDAAAGTHPVAVLGYGLWQSRFGADPGLIGKTIHLNRTALTVVGIGRAGFRGLSGSAEAWVPMQMAPVLSYPEALEERWSHWIEAVGRRAPGVTPQQGLAELERVGRLVAEAHPSSHGASQWGATAVPLREARLDPVLRSSVLMLFGAVGFVLLIGCVNLANLQLSRAAARRRELAVRVALGASRGRLARHLLCESVLLALAGGAAGLVLAMWGVDALVSLRPERAAGWGVRFTQLLDLDSSRIDAGVLTFNLGLSVATGLLFGLLPALRGSRPNVAEDLKEGTAAGTAGLGSLRRPSLRALLVVGEVALALVLLIGAGLMIRSLANLRGVDPGFDPQGVLTLRLELPETQYSMRDAPAVYERLLGRIAELPGVRGASLDRCTPLSGRCNKTLIGLSGQPPVMDGSEPPIGVHFIGPDHLRTMRIALQRGRGFTAQDRAGAPKVVLINETAARRFWPGRDPIGQRVWLGIALLEEGETTEVVGVVGDVRYGAADEAVGADAYVAALQYAYRSTYVLVRGEGDPAALAAGVQREVKALDKDLPVFDVKTMEARVADALSRTRFSTLLLAVFSGAALLLAAIGIYGVMAYSVVQRGREIGIRMALGARRADVLRLVIGQAAAMTLLGVGLGLGAALGLTQVLASLVHGVSTTDPGTFGALALLLAAVALAASSVPAWRAARVDPMQALRDE